MELIPISCHHCGAPLQIPPQAEFVTCQHCRTQLAVCRNESVAWTEALEELDERTELLAETADELARRLAQVEYERSLDHLARRWSSQSAAVRSRHSSDDPVMEAASVAAVLVLGGLIFGLVLLHESTFLGTLTMVLCAIGAAFAVWCGVQEDNHRRATKQRYATARAAIHTQFFAQYPVDSASSANAVAYPGLPALDEPS